jgi:hypothetical protein
MSSPAFDIARRVKRRLSGDASEVVAGDDPTAFLKREMYIADTRRPITLHPEQEAVLREMFRRDESGFVYQDMVYSSIKKSAKTTLAAGLLLWQGFRVAHGNIYIIGNDLRQADSRIAQAVRECIELNPRMHGIKLPTSTYRITLPNRTRIETIPVDPTGESGMNPSAIFLTEAWGAKTRAHEMLYTEARLSPTRTGESFKFIESYAGHTGESMILWRLYDAIVKKGTALAHVAPQLYASGKQIAYWNTRPYLPWQTPDYYAAERADMLPKEYRRIHENEWVTSEDSFIDEIWWDACRDSVPPFDARTPQIVAVDAGVSSDCFGIVALAHLGSRYVPVRVKVYVPQGGQQLNFKGPGSPDAFLREYVRQWNVLEICYDPHQLHSLMGEYRTERIVRVSEFNQGDDRALADKGLLDAIKAREILHDGNADLRAHVLNANVKTDGNDSRLRLVKRTDEMKIDLAVCLSMALARMKYLRV